MLKNLPFTGTTRVANQGMDVALAVTSTHVEQAMAAVRRCSVCGVSTAALEVTVLTPPDQGTLEDLGNTAGWVVFESQALRCVYRIADRCITAVVAGYSVKLFFQAVLKMHRIKKTESDGRGGLV